MKLKIRIYGDPCLRQKSEMVQDVGPGERMLIEAMFETMYKTKGIGLAAPQVGINKQIFVADTGNQPIAVINPKIIKKTGKAILEEGCLSIPGVHVDVTRPARILVRYIEPSGRTVEREFSDLMARVFLHENDHLQGKLIVDYADEKRRPEIEKQLQDILHSKS